MVDSREIDRRTEEITEEVIAIRRAIHENPELGFEEHETASWVAELLTGRNIPIKTGIGGTGVVGLIEGATPGPTIALRGDMDALPMDEESGVPFASKTPGKMHACGHDAHTAILLGAAFVLNDLRDQLKGRIKLIFQPAEELLTGAEAMIGDGVLEDPEIDFAIGYHNLPSMTAGRVGYHGDVTYASADAFDITLRGISGHGAHPHMAVDVITAAAYFITELQTVVSREVSPVHPAVVSIGKIVGGTARNILPDTLILEGTVRTLDPGARKYVEEAMRRLLGGIKTGMRIDYELDYRNGVPVMQNDPKVLASVARSARDILGKDAVVELLEYSMASEDFAYFTERVPSVHLRIGSKIDGLDTAAHRSNYDCNELAIPTGIRVLTRSALDLLGKNP
ncbi:MAG: amidohydrolase [Rhodospirillales bacterium]|nr:amidohydrolase [Rhodospirillales bacterium]